MKRGTFRKWCPYSGHGLATAAGRSDRTGVKWGSWTSGKEEGRLRPWLGLKEEHQPQEEAARASRLGADRGKGSLMSH